LRKSEIHFESLTTAVFSVLTPASSRLLTNISEHIADTLENTRLNVLISFTFYEFKSSL
jgi:hypothetical protein